MRIRSFIIAYALVLAILLFAERRPRPTPQDRYSHVIDLTRGRDVTFITHIIAPDSLIPGTWTAAQIPPGRLVVPLVVIDLTCHPERSEGPAVSTFAPNLAPRFTPNDSSRQVSLAILYRFYRSTPNFMAAPSGSILAASKRPLLLPIRSSFSTC